MTTIDTSAPVMVTGATGYVAGWLVKALLGAGAPVHAPVRDPSNVEKLKFLTAIADASPGTLKLFKADLLQPGSYAEAMQGCRVVFHTASPFTLNVKDPQRDLIDPALNGTKNVLEAVNATKSVQRVVVTSSCAAIYADATDVQHAPGGRLDESVWNTTASLTYQPYSYSKTLAERAAWQIAEAQTRWRLVTINPSFVLGPAIGGAPTSESFAILRQAGSGMFRFGAPRVGIGMIDVRDLAQAHVAAGFRPEAHGRNIISGYDTDILTLVMTLRDTYGARYPIPRNAMPKWLLWLVAPMVGLERRFVAHNVNVAWHADSSKATQELGLTYRPMKETMEDMFQYMIDANMFAK